MSINLFKLRKLVWLFNPLNTLLYLRYRVVPTVEHQKFFRSAPRFATVLDIGANNGQFALFVLNKLPGVRVFSFEPLPLACKSLYKIARTYKSLIVINKAVSSTKRLQSFYITKKSDSSSFLPPSSLQVSHNPSSDISSIVQIESISLEDYLSNSILPGPILLKIDVQGTELEVLRSAASVLCRVDCIYAELSFVELYSGQDLATEFILLCHAHGFRLHGVYNVVLSANGQPLQADFSFMRI
jgi:FkbM family methyltransferase